MLKGTYLLVYCGEKRSEHIKFHTAHGHGKRVAVRGAKKFERRIRTRQEKNNS